MASPRSRGVEATRDGGAKSPTDSLAAKGVAVLTAAGNSGVCPLIPAVMLRPVDPDNMILARGHSRSSSPSYAHHRCHGRGDVAEVLTRPRSRYIVRAPLLRLVRRAWRIVMARGAVARVVNCRVPRPASSVEATMAPNHRFDTSPRIPLQGGTHASAGSRCGRAWARYPPG